MSRLAMHLLGPPRLERDGAPVQIDRRKAVALIAYLAVTGKAHSRDALATLFWPELDQSRARAGLRGALASLRKALGEGWLDVDKEIVRLPRDADPSTGSGQAPSTDSGRVVWLDVAEFQDKLAECRMHGHPQDQVCPACFPLLTEAVALYRDDFLAGFTLRDSPGFDDWQFFETQALRDLLASALERLAHGHGVQGEFEPAVACARRWVALDPLHEPAHRCLMQLYAWSGQRAAALRQYAECERVLKEELGVPPAEETIQLHQAIKEKQDLPLPVGRTTAPVSPPTVARRHNLPVQPTPFVGREAVLAGIAGCLQDPACRLLTLVGPGGSGKTRLALEVGMAQLSIFEHGVFFVSLAPLDSVEAIVPTVAEALGFSFHERGEPQQQLLDYLRTKTVLLIMDNFEHLLTCPERRPELVEGPRRRASPEHSRRACPEHSRREGTGLVTDILETAPHVKILATSRARLNVQGERPFPVAGMNVPHSETAKDAAQYSAVKLFLERARWVRPDFEPATDDMTHVARICRVVEGMPLAILLAAGWVPMLTPAEIAAEIKRSLDFLETDLRDVPTRQRSMRAVFDHSWRLLTEREREVLQELSVFRGGFTREAAQRVTGASLRELRALADKSLLHRTPTGRYEVHELTRQYGAEKLGHAPEAEEAVRDRHSAYYTAALQRWSEDLQGSRQQAALAEMEADSENARGAWNWAVERGLVERLDQALMGLCLFYTWRWRYQEGEAVSRMAAERLSPAPSAKGLRVLVKALAGQCYFNRRLGHIERARQVLGPSLALLERPELAGQDTRWEKAFVLNQMGGLAHVSGNREEARRLSKQSLALYQALGDRFMVAEVLDGLGVTAVELGDYGEAKQFLEEGLATLQVLGATGRTINPLRRLGLIALYQGQLGEAERLIREGIAICQEMGDRFGIGAGLYYWGCVLCDLGLTLLCAGQFGEGHSLIEESIGVWNDHGHRGSSASLSHNYLGIAHMGQGRYGQARVQGQMGLTLAQETHAPREVGLSHYLLGCVALAEKAHPEAQRLLQESAAIWRRIGQRQELGWALAGLGYAAHGLGQLSQAGEHLCEALRLAAEIGSFLTLMTALPATALLLADQGEKERAVELYALASCYPFVSNSCWLKDVAGKHIATVAATLPPDAVAAAQERGQARDLEATVAELLVELEGTATDGA